MTTVMPVGPHAGGDTLRTMLLVAVGRALAFMLLVVVLATAARGPLPGLSLAPAADGPGSEGHAVVVEPLDGGPDGPRAAGAE